MLLADEPAWEVFLREVAGFLAKDHADPSVANLSERERQILLLAAAAVAFAAAFVAWQRRAAEPLMPMRIFTGHRNYPLAVVLILVVGVVMFTGGLYLPLFQQVVQHASATNSGLLMLPMLAPVVVVSTIAAQ